jgi:hypothetical protein
MGRIYSKATTVVVFLGHGLGQRRTTSRRGRQLEQYRFEGTSADTFYTSHFLSRWKAPCTPKRVTESDIFCLVSILSRAQNLVDPFAPLDGIPQPALTAIFEGLRKLLTSRWWDRVWVVQEAVLAKTITIRFGNASAPWELLADVAKLCPQQKLYPEIQQVSASDIKVLSLLSKATDIDLLRQTWRQNEKPGLLFVLRKFSNRQASDERDKIYALLGLCNSDIPLTPDYSRTTIEAYRETTLDIIRASNSLEVLSGDVGRKNRQDLPSWVPDWSATFGDYDRERVPFLSQYNACGKVGSTHTDAIPSPHTQHQMALLAERLEAKHGQEASLPRCLSRAIQDYGRRHPSCRDVCIKLVERCGPRGQPSVATFTTTGFIKDGPKIPQRRFTDKDLSTESFGARENEVWVDTPWEGCLRTRGKRIAAIAHSFNPVYTSSNMESVSDTIMDWLKNALRYNEGQTTQHTMEEFVTTLLSAIKKTPNGFERLKEADQSTILEWFYTIIEGREISNSQVTAEELNAITHVFKLSVTMRAFFITDDGRMGLGPTSTAAGDIVHVLPGGNLPFILRWANPPADIQNHIQELRTFRLVGDCFLYGALDPELSFPQQGSLPDWIIDRSIKYLREEWYQCFLKLISIADWNLEREEPFSHSVLDNWWSKFDYTSLYGQGKIKRDMRHEVIEVINEMELLCRNWRLLNVDWLYLI